MWKYLLVAIVCCVGCEKPVPTATEQQQDKPYDQKKNEELKALKVDLETTMDGRSANVENAVVESAQE